MAKLIPPVVGNYFLVDPNSVTPAPNNHNVQSPAMFANLVRTIQKHGFVDPIIVRELANGKYETVAGAHRLAAAKQLKIPQIPAVNLGQLSDSEAATRLIALQEIRGSADQDRLASLVRMIHDTEGMEALSVLPYTDAQIAVFLDDDNLAALAAMATAESSKPDRDDDEKKARKVSAKDVVNALEMESASPLELKDFITAIRIWRAEQDPLVPTWELLRGLIKDGC